MKKILKNQKGSSFVEMLFVFPLILMLFIFIIEMGFLMYDWAVISYYTSTAAVVAATQGQFCNAVSNNLANNIKRMTVNGRELNFYRVPNKPTEMSEDGVYIWGTLPNERVQKGENIFVNVSYPWQCNFFLIGALGNWIIGEKALRLDFSFVFPSEVFFEGE